ncbi:MAG TPA: hypothetical protein VN213_13560 [Solirubrobacteraceae bacterium]|nr:hypothetical protein [Solirubrobacteraceae bacterium]
MLRRQRQPVTPICGSCGIELIHLDGKCRGCFWEDRAREFHDEVRALRRENTLRALGIDPLTPSRELPADVQVILAASGSL